MKKDNTAKTAEENGWCIVVDEPDNELYLCIGENGLYIGTAPTN